MNQEEKERYLRESEDYFNDRILGWMVSDLRKSIKATTNFLTALGCFTYTEVVGMFLPPVEKERCGKIEEKYFYRCLFRFPSGKELEKIDELIRNATQSQQGIYKQMRHGMAHHYYPTVKRRQSDGSYRFVPCVIARDAESSRLGQSVPPLCIDIEDRIGITTKIYVDELEETVQSCMKRIFIDKDPIFEEAAVKGIKQMIYYRSL